MFSKVCMSEMDKKIPDLRSNTQLPLFDQMHKQSDSKLPFLNSDKILPNMQSDKTLGWFEKSDQKSFLANHSNFPGYPHQSMQTSTASNYSSDGGSQYHFQSPHQIYQHQRMNPMSQYPNFDPTKFYGLVSSSPSLLPMTISPQFYMNHFHPNPEQLKNLASSQSSIFNQKPIQGEQNYEKQ